MLERLLLPQITGLELTDVKYEEGEFIVDAHLASTTAQCPKCQEASRRIHSYYQRRIADLPWAGYPVLLVLQVRRFLCRNPACKRQVFCERLAPEVAAYARRTTRLHKQVRVLALGMGGEQTARVLPVLGMRGSPATLLHYIRTLPVRTDVKVRVVGLDDWAKRKGQAYGTILVDLEQGSVVDLLADRTAATVAAWLKEHPEVEVISRDRFANYAEGATQGAPNAVQVADRFHLLKNLNDALQRMLDCHAPALRQAAQLAAEPQPAEHVAEPVPPPVTLEERQESRLDMRFSEVKALKQQGLSNRAIARQTGMNRRTVRRYVVHDQVPVRAPAPQSTSTLLPYMDYVQRRLAEGCHQITQLHQEVTALGFQGNYHVVYRAVRRLSPSTRDRRNGRVPQKSVPPLSSRQAARLLVQAKEKLEPQEQKLLEALLAVSLPIATAHQLAQQFYQIVRQREAGRLDTWLAAAHQSGIPELQRFAEGLVRDYSAVKAALTLEWSNGPVEGFVNKLKTVKRQMFGRGKLDLLRQRLVNAM
jgi:transposase